MSETTEIETVTAGSGRPTLWFAVLTAFVAAAVWATVAMAAGGSGSSGASPPAAPHGGGPHAMYAVSGSHAHGDCPNMGDDSGGGSTTPSAPAPATPSTQDGSSNSAL